ncbi:cytochrome d ubiquinol oxidase subunit II [Salmonella enterica]|nr:cytochrome d ubiquinol oxidase subunit II [Salmonella enterica]
MGMDLSVIWFVIIVFATLMYIVMDGFDLGIGILFPMVQNADDRDVMVNSVAPVWDGNETWLVLGGAGLFGAFPLAYAVIIDALTIPLTLMLIGLIFRGVAFEFRFKATPTHRPFWDKAFLFGSLLATFTQGIVVGAVINGFTVTGRAYSGGPFDWFTPFTLFCGIGLVMAYALLGATWLVMKSENPLQDKMRNLAKKLLIALLLTITIISLWTPLTHHAIAERWFTLPNLWFLLPVPLFVALFSLGAWRSLNQQHYHALPFVLTLGLIFLGFSGLGISIWPHIIPPSITLWQAAAPTQSQGFMLVGALLIIPIILV